MIEINSLALYGLDDEYYDDFKSLYNVNLEKCNNYAFIMNKITDDPSLCIQSDYKIICKNDNKTSFSLLHIEKLDSVIINQIIKWIEINKDKFKLPKIYLGGIFFCSFQKYTTPDLVKSNMFNIIDYIKKDLKVNFTSKLIYGLCDLENNILVIFCNNIYYVCAIE